MSKSLYVDNRYESVNDLDMDAADGPAPPVDPSPLLPHIIRCCRSEGQATDLVLDRSL
jgi:hypothetical protein